MLGSTARRATVAPVTILVVWAAIRHFQAVFTTAIHYDEQFYLAAAEAAARGDNPLAVEGFLYHPVFAVAGAIATSLFGQHVYLVLLRCLNLVGAVFIVWWSTGLARWRPAIRLGLSSLLIAFSPLIVEGVRYGNISHAIIALLFGGLMMAPKVPKIGGILLGVALAIKPIALPALPMLLFYRSPGDRRHRFRSWPVRTVCTALLSMAFVSLVGTEYLPSLLAKANTEKTALFDLSLGHVAHSFGFPISSALLFLSMTALGTLWATKAPSSLSLLVFIASFSLLGLPVVWPHILSLSLPLQVLAVSQLHDRWVAYRTGPEPPPPQRIIQVGFVVVSILAIQASNGVAGGGLLPLPIHGLVALLPLLSVALLTLYVQRNRWSHPAT